MMNNFESLSDEALDLRLMSWVRHERNATAEVVAHVAEASRRELYLKHDCVSLFEYLTKHLGYSHGSAQRRLEAARLLTVVPAVKDGIASGELSLTQLTEVSRGLRQKQKEGAIPREFLTQVKIDLIEEIKHKETHETQKIVAQALDFKVQTQEKAKTQKDESMRIELTLTKEQLQELMKAKKLSSHVNPSPTWAELFVYLAKFHNQKKDPTRPVKQRTRNSMKGDLLATSELSTDSPAKTQNHFHVEVNPPINTGPAQAENHSSQKRRVPIPKSIQRLIHQRDQSCRWRSSQGHACQSKHQLQIDHIQPLWAGGSSAPENLQLLCATHNQRKYKQEAGIKPG